MTEWVLAIDFGTTTTSAAMGSGRGDAEVVEVDGAARMPSVVLATDSGGLVVGSAAEAQMALSPERAERTPKRRLGDEVILLGDRPVRPVEAVAAILGAISAEAIRRQGGVAPGELRLTHPARWGSLRREKLAEAARLAGLPQPVFVPEPVAAAVHYLDERIEDGSFVAVYDLGGGTFDTAVLRRSGDGFDVVGLPGGDEHLGGEVFDERLFAHVGSRIAQGDEDAWENLRFSSERSWRKVGHDLRLEVRRAKEALSANTEYTIYVGPPVDATVLLTRDELEDLIRGDVASTVDELTATVERSGVAVEDLAAVNLTGGSSRIPLVTRLVAERFGQLPQTWGDPKAAVALGAVKATRLTSVATGGRSVTAATAALPQDIGGHEVIAELGRGGMGVVYLARQRSVGRLVAVKTLPVVDPNLTDRLRREATVLAELQHPNVATLIDVGTDERGTHVVMPYFPGGTLSHVLDQRGPLSPGQAASVLASVAAALAATHDKGFLHRDVKPSNVLLSSAGDPYLADFGLALPMLDSSRLTNSRSVLGTAPYTAPEILADETPTPAADTYALGVTGYQLLTGELPYAGSNVLAVLDAVRRGEPTPVAELAPAVPPALAALVTAAFAADPADRPADLRQWAAEVRASVTPEAVEPAPPAAWAAAAAGGAPLATMAAAGPPESASDQPTGSDGPPTGELTAAEAAVGAGMSAPVASSPPVSTGGSGAEPPDVADLVGYQPREPEGSPLADVPERHSRVPAPKVLGGAAAVIVLVVAALFLFTRGDDPELVSSSGSTTTSEGNGESDDGEIEVPNVLRKNGLEATAQLEKLGLKVKIAYENSPGHTELQVLDQSPAAGATLAKGDEVRLVLHQTPKADPGGSTDGGPTDGGSTGGGSTGGGSTGGGSTDGGSTGGGSTGGGSTGGGSTDGGSTDGGSTDGSTTSPPQNDPPVPTSGSSNPDEYTLGDPGSPYYNIWFQPTAFSDPDGDSWAFYDVYDAEAQFGYVSIFRGAEDSCSSRVGGGCIRYTPTDANRYVDCFSDWVVFTAYDPGGSGLESAQYWLKIWVNC